MTRLCCARCRLRFSPAVAAYITACPECGGSPEPITSLSGTLGFRLVGPEDVSDELPHALASSITFPEPEARS